MGALCLLGRRWRQVVAALVVVGAVLNTGMMVGWSVVVSRIMETSSSIQVNQIDQEWIVSSAAVAGIVGTAVTGSLMEVLGPCRLLCGLLLPSFLGWLVMALSESLPWLYVGRVITGGIALMLPTIAQPLVAEFSQPEIRGFVSALPEVFLSLGLLLAYVFARFLTWQVTTLLCGLFLLPVMSLILFVPESPYWLLRRGREKDAARALSRLRSENHSAEEELSSMRQAPLQPQMSLMQQWRLLFAHGNYRPVLLLVLIFVLRELGGAMVIFMYAAYFFEMADTTLDPFTTTVLLGVTRLIATIVSAVIIDRTGRRPLLMASAMVCAIAMGGAAAALHTDPENLAWLSLTCVLIYVFSYGLGVGPAPWILIGELLPTPVRLLGASVVTCVFAILMFIMTHVFPDVIAAVSLAWAVLAFALANVVLVVVAWVWLPETKGRSLEDLQGAFASDALEPARAVREGYVQAYGATFHSAPGPSGASKYQATEIR
ncbi:facilitated trehalose transporter Tret1-like [Oratosquilla oratoria]|uniref:facilitated trehalose transporter Tret1-like n=1 Tax=Oratosquilla oratoria TaxID=337810 RepID=UPI003F766F30